MTGVNKSGNVLFVDDERNILKSLRRALINSDFNIFLACGGEEGLKVLENEEIDIVITDYKMPGMTGLQFLDIVRNRFPSVYRAVLSGFVEETAVFRSIVGGLTLAYFLKPWEDDNLKERIEHILHVRRLLSNDVLVKCVNSIKTLPILPDIYYKVKDAICQDLSIKEIFKIIKGDVSMSTKILQIANSAFFRKRNELSLERVLVYLGVQNIKDIIFTLSFSGQMSAGGVEIKKLEEFSRYSYIVNKFFSHVFELLHETRVKSIYSSMGLTHDIGRLILLQYFPQRLEQIEDMQNMNPSLNFHQCELELGFENSTHCELGAYFLESWNFAECNVDAALFHHTPWKSTEEFKHVLEVMEFVINLAEHASMSVKNRISGSPQWSYDKLSDGQIEDIYNKMISDFSTK